MYFCAIFRLEKEADRLNLSICLNFILKVAFRYATMVYKANAEKI